METNTTQAILFPEPTGPYAVGTTSLYFADPEREEIFTEDPNDIREITARVWYPSEEISGATTALYMKEELAGAFASGLGIPPDEFVSLIRSIPTNSVENAPVAAAESKYPILFLSHGGTDLPEFNTVRAEELASQGYVVVAINHTHDSALNILPDGRVIPHTSLFDTATREGSDSEFLRLQAENVALRAGDVKFVLDELEKFNAGNDPTGLFSGKFDLDRVGVFGNSTGGATAAEVLSIDPRFKAGANLDGTLRGDTPNASLSQPYLQFNNVAFGTEISSDATARSFDSAFFNNLQNQGYEVTIRGATHLHFTSDVPFLFPLLRDSGIELGGLEGSFNYFFDPQATIQSYEHKNFELIDPNQVTQITNDYITTFFDQYLSNQKSPLFADNSFPLPEAYPEVIAQFYKGNYLTSPERNGDDILSGGHENDLLHGGAGDDVLTGSDGSDALHGGEGDNSLNGGNGSDYLFGHGGNDVLHGGEGNDFLRGFGGDDVLRGGNGKDSLIGGDGEDTMSGGEADDVLTGGAGDDLLRDTQGNNILYGDAGNDRLQAGQGNDKLDGDSGNDTLIGGNGDNRLNGGTGDDLLQGGSGVDQFYLSSDRDIIRGFEDGRDLLGLPTTTSEAFYGTSLSFNDLDVVQMGQNTEIRWTLEGSGELGSQMHVTILEGIQANQITVHDFV
ncbi:hypothetical protein IFO70_20040 [Phormidium tenue FACHB-886]|nr:hypothetical protein [Phormidium tenue FACHB-886]